MAEIQNKDLAKLFNVDTIKKDIQSVLDCSIDEALENIQYKFENVVDVDIATKEGKIDVILDLVFVYKNYEYECNKFIHIYPIHTEKLNKIKKLVWKLTNMDELKSVFENL